jgi:hypothetical protein
MRLQAATSAALAARPQILRSRRLIFNGLQAAPAYAHQKLTDVPSGFENDRRFASKLLTLYYLLHFYIFVRGVIHQRSIGK